MRAALALLAAGLVLPAYPERAYAVLSERAGSGSKAIDSVGGDFKITREVIGGGGSVVAGTDFVATTTVGQHALGVASGGDFVVRGGFHIRVGDGTPPGEAIFRDGFEPE